jgi:hypothetical protein
MDKLFEYLNEKSLNDINLKEVKKSLPEFINNDINKFCYSKAIFNLKKYNKIKLTDFSNDKFELIIICWDENSETLIHDHPDNGCVLYLIDGVLEEELYNKSLKLIKKSVYRPKNISYMHNVKGYHKIKCQQKAISLHIYSPPNYQIKTFTH